MERRETGDWLAGGEEEESAKPKAFAAAVRMISNIGVFSESAFASTIIPMPPSRAAPMAVILPVHLRRAQWPDGEVLCHPWVKTGR